MNIAVAAVLLGLVVLLSGGIGYVWSDRNAAQAIATARSDTTTCAEASAVKEAALDTVMDRLDKLRSDHAALRAIADAALDERDAAIERLLTETTARSDRLRIASTHDPDTASLAGLAVPPAVARELWPAAAEKAGAQPAGNH